MKKESFLGPQCVGCSQSVLRYIRKRRSMKNYDKKNKSHEIKFENRKRTPQKFKKFISFDTSLFSLLLVLIYVPIVVQNSLFTPFPSFFLLSPFHHCLYFLVLLLLSPTLLTYSSLLTDRTSPYSHIFLLRR